MSCMGEMEPADKPGSVLDNHSSGLAVASSLERPTRRHRGPRLSLPIWSCFGWGLPSRSVLPPARCALTAPFHPYQFPGGIFSVALSVGSRPPGVTWHPALRSPDFPRYGYPQRDCLADSQRHCLTSDAVRAAKWGQSRNSDPLL